MNYSKLFTSLGLSKTETKIYLASLELGPTTVQLIAKKAKLSRTAAYDAVASLQERGLMSTSQQGKKKFFIAEDPERAVAYFKSKMVEMEANLETLHKSAQDIKMLRGGSKPIMRFYEGNEAVYALFNDIEKSETDYFWEFVNYEDIKRIIDRKFLDQAAKIFSSGKINIRQLHAGDMLTPPKNKREYRTIPPTLGEFHGDIAIYGDRVALLTFIGTVMVVIIENETLAQTARIFYEIAWQASKPSQPKKTV